MRSNRRLSPPTGRKPHRNARQGQWAFLLSELIGERVRVTDASGKDLSGLEGRVLDETRETFLVLTSRGVKRVPKQGSTFLFPDLSQLEVPGAMLRTRPEDRTKRLSARLTRA